MKWKTMTRSQRRELAENAGFAVVLLALVVGFVLYVQWCTWVWWT